MGSLKRTNHLVAASTELMRSAYIKNENLRKSNEDMRRTLAESRESITRLKLSVTASTEFVQQPRSVFGLGLRA